ncbi:hypothetical protein ACFSM5_17635 [Lacibacterium aquatile]|uniref:Uncharacterized protein n=1 Tax=Lacibacterium aquatile TaxID=1168082 RepID=A0ABW5DW78_9PROT
MYRRSDQFKPDKQPVIHNNRSKNTSPTNNTGSKEDGSGSRLRSAISGFSIFDDAETDTPAQKVAPPAPARKPGPGYQPPFSEARRTMQKIVAIAIGLSSMPIIYVFAKALSANIMKMAPIH